MDRAPVVALLGLVAVTLGLSACGGALPAPPFGDGDHTGEEPQVVLSMPPPGNVEVAPPPPKGMKHPVWVDGEWIWSGRRWTWQEHGWTELPAGQVYDLPVTRRLPDGHLVHFAGKWVPAPK